MATFLLILTMGIILPGRSDSNASCADVDSAYSDSACAINLLQLQSRALTQPSSNAQKSVRGILPVLHSNRTSSETRDLSEATCESFGWKKKASHVKRRVIDGYAYNGEAIIAKARYEELKDYINGTGILITDANFKGEIKDPVEPPNVLGSRVVRLPVTAFEKCGSQNQSHFNDCALSITKNSIATAVEMFELSDDDWVIFSDPDEIPDREVIRLLHECEVPVGPDQESDYIQLHAAGHYMYTFDCAFPKSPWRDASCTSHCRGPVVLRPATMRKFGLRAFQNGVEPWCVKKGPYATCEEHSRHTLLLNTYWHLSSFGGPDAFSQKMQDNSDSFDYSNMKDAAKRCIDISLSHPRDMKLSRVVAHPLIYPWIPHSVAGSPKQYPKFFTWESEEEGASEEDGI